MRANQDFLDMVERGRVAGESEEQFARRVLSAAESLTGKRVRPDYDGITAPSGGRLPSIRFVATKPRMNQATVLNSQKAHRAVIDGRKRQADMIGEIIATAAGIAATSLMSGGVSVPAGLAAVFNKLTSMIGKGG